MAVSIFARIGTIKGESRDAKHKCDRNQLRRLESGCPLKRLNDLTCGFACTCSVGLTGFEPATP